MVPVTPTSHRCAARPTAFGRSSNARDGFSLVETLAVIAIAAVLVSIGFSSIGTTSAHQLNAGGNRVVDLVNLARQNAISKRTMTALILLTNTNQPAVDNRVFLIEEFDATTSSWRQVSKWETLPPGVVVDNTATTPSTDTFLTSVPTLSAPATLPSLSYLGQNITPSNYACQIFLPQGQVLSTATSIPPVLRMVSGSVVSGHVTYTTGHANSVLNNYYNVTINLYTGLPKVTRP